MKKQGKYPVIYLTFKDEKHNDFDEFIESMTNRISSIYIRAFIIFIIALKFKNDKDYFNRYYK